MYVGNNNTSLCILYIFTVRVYITESHYNICYIHSPVYVIFGSRILKKQNKRFKKIIQKFKNLCYTHFQMKMR